MRRFHTRDQEKPDVKNTCLEAATSFTIQSRSQAINGHCIQKVQATSHPMEIGLQLTVYMPAGLPERFVVVKSNKLIIYICPGDFLCKPSEKYSSSPCLVPKKFPQYPSHQIFGHMHIALNVVKKILITQFNCKRRDGSFNLLVYNQTLIVK